MARAKVSLTATASSRCGNKFSKKGAGTIQGAKPTGSLLLGVGRCTCDPVGAHNFRGA